MTPHLGWICVLTSRSQVCPCVRLTHLCAMLHGGKKSNQNSRKERCLQLLAYLLQQPAVISWFQHYHFGVWVFISFIFYYFQRASFFLVRAERSTRYTPEGLGKQTTTCRGEEPAPTPGRTTPASAQCCHEKQRSFQLDSSMRDLRGTHVGTPSIFTPKFKI